MSHQINLRSYLKMISLIVSCTLALPVLAETVGRQIKERSSDYRIEKTSEPEITWEAEFGMSVSDRKSEDKYEDSKDNRTSTYRIFLGSIAAYRIFGNFEAGPTFLYRRIDSKTSYENPSRKAQPSTDIDYGGGFVGKYNFGDIQTERTVPFVMVGFNRNLGESYYTSAENEILCGFGLNWFLARNIALNSQLQYKQSTEYNSKGDYGSAYRSNDTDLLLRWGVSTFF